MLQERMLQFAKKCISSSTDFLNVYEESKAQAENIIFSFAKRIQYHLQ